MAPQEAFPTRTLTRWQSSPVQTVELDALREGEAGPETIRYRLEVEQDPEHRRCRILREEVEGLRAGTSGPLFRFQDGQVQLFGDDHTPGQEFPFDWKGSDAAGGVVNAQLFSELSGGGVSQTDPILGGASFPADWTQVGPVDITVGPDVSGGITLEMTAICGADPGCASNMFFDNVSIKVPVP